MRNFGKMSLLSELEDSELPQLVMGRILPVSKLLTAPISGKHCVYYEVRVEQLVELTDENGLSGEVEGNKVWEYRCGETVAADFTLSDPFSPSNTLYVPGAQVQIQVHATEDVRAGRSKIIKHTRVPHHTLEFMARHQFSCTDSKGMLNKTVRFRESSFEFGEQIAVLGIVRTFAEEAGEVHKVLYPMGSEVFTREFCKAKGWSDRDRRSWQDLTKKPSVILTDMPDYFQGIKIVEMPDSRSVKLSKPIHITSGFAKVGAGVDAAANMER